MHAQTVLYSNQIRNTAFHDKYLTSYLFSHKTAKTSWKTCRINKFNLFSIQSNLRLSS